MRSGQAEVQAEAQAQGPDQGGQLTLGAGRQQEGAHTAQPDTQRQVSGQSKGQSHAGVYTIVTRVPLEEPGAERVIAEDPASHHQRTQGTPGERPSTPNLRP